MSQTVAPTAKRKEKAAPPRLVVTERVDAILLLLHEYRALSSEQIAEFLALRGWSQQYTGKKLTALDAIRFIDQINKRWTYITEGTPHRIWGLGDEGAKRLEERYGL